MYMLNLSIGLYAYNQCSASFALVIGTFIVGITRLIINYSSHPEDSRSYQECQIRDINRPVYMKHGVHWFPYSNLNTNGDNTPETLHDTAPFAGG